MSRSFMTSGRGRTVTMMTDSMTDTDAGRTDIYWLDEVSSTMDKVMSLLAKINPILIKYM